MHIVWTRHASEVMAKRAIPKSEVLEAICNPLGTEPHEGRIRYVGDNGITVVAAKTPNALVIVTVLLRRVGQWTDTDARNLWTLKATTRKGLR